MFRGLLVLKGSIGPQRFFLLDGVCGFTFFVSRGSCFSFSKFNTTHIKISKTQETVCRLGLKVSIMVGFTGLNLENLDEGT